MSLILYTNQSSSDLPFFPDWLNLPLLLGFQKMPRMDCLSKQQIHPFLSASCRTAQHSKMRAVGSLCCHDHYIYFKKGDSKVAELKAAHYNPIWLEIRIMQVKYAEIKMMMQGKKGIVPLPLELEGECVSWWLQTSLVLISNTVFETWSSRAEACQPYSANQQLSLWLLWKGIWK